MEIAIESLNYREMFIRHRDFLGELSVIQNDLDRRDATFRVLEGLADSKLVSLGSQNYGNHVLRHHDFRIKLSDHTGANDTPLLRDDATFILTPGLADPTAVSFRSMNRPDLFLRHRDFHLFLEPVTDAARLDATFRIVPGFLPHFTFNTSISTANVDKLIERHRVAIASIGPCNRVSGQEKQELIRAYDKSIHHNINGDPTANASAPVGGSTINVNFGVLFPQGDTEISQTLIHEMMHSAGQEHPIRRDAPTGQTCATTPPPRTFDCPNDNGPYYGTSPLRAEFCIAGNQSDQVLRIAQKSENERCDIDMNGIATLHRE